MAYWLHYRVWVHDQGTQRYSDLCGVQRALHITARESAHSGCRCCCRVCSCHGAGEARQSAKGVAEGAPHLRDDSGWTMACWERTDVASSAADRPGNCCFLTKPYCI